MRKTILTAIILSAILFIACTRLPDTIPDDLEIDYSYHASYGGAGIEVKIDSQGSAILIESDSADDFFESDKSGLEQGFDLDEEELLGIYQEIVKNNFFSLRERYENPDILDGDVYSIRVKANGREHKVTVLNTNIERFDRIAEAVEKIIDAKKADISSSRKDALYNVAELHAVELGGAGLFLVGQVFLDNAVEKFDDFNDYISIAHASFGIFGKCLDGYEEKTKEREVETGPLDFIDFYLMTNEEFKSLKACAEKKEDEGYCSDTADCCKDYPDEDMCDMVCAENECISK